MMSDITLLLVLIGACFRLTHLISGDEPGPWDILETLRWYASEIGLGELVHCHWCSSVWVAGVLCLVLQTDLVSWGVTSLAVSGFALLIWEFVECLSNIGST